MELYILDPDLQIEGVVDDVESKLWIKKFSDIGECEIYSPYTDELRELLKRGNYVYRFDDDMACIITDIEITTDAEEGDYIIATGKDVCTILSGRIVRWPTVFSGLVTDFVFKLLDENVINPNPATRKIPNFKIDKSSFTGISATIEASVQTEDLLNLIIATCKSAGCGFRVKVDIGDGSFVFALQAGYDRSTGLNDSYIEFSQQFANILETNYKESDGNFKNVVYIGYKTLDGSVMLMSVLRGDKEPTGLDRKEVYIDGTGTSREITFEELRVMYPNCSRVGNEIRSGTTKLATIETTGEGDEQKEKITVTDEPYLRIIRRLATEAFGDYTESKDFNGSVDVVDTYKYKVDYDLGDTVFVMNRYGISAPAKIVEVQESEDIEDGYQLEPMFEYFD